jgi:hypothetical protein
MSNAHGETTICITTDEEGETLAQYIPVHITYVALVDHSYGEDADGNRGTVLKEYEILDIHIDARDLWTLTAARAEWAIESARVLFLETAR